MSFKKGAPSFPLTIITKSCSTYREKIASEIAAALRQEYGRKLPPSKKIAKNTDTTARAVKNWFSGRNGPDSANLILLMQYSDAVLTTVLQLANRHYLVPHIMPSELGDILKIGANVGAAQGPINERKKGPIKLESDNSLLRQEWFVDQIREDKSPSAASIALYWGVGLKRAKKDIQALKERGAIAFVGAKKNGRYELIE